MSSVADILSAPSSVRAFELEAGPYRSELEVVSFTGFESISELFEFDIVLDCPSDDDFLATLEAELLGKPATLILHGAFGAQRHVRGILNALWLDSADTQAYGSRIRARLVPTLWLATQRTHSRIFQEKNVPEIVGLVLGEWGIRFSLDLIRSYPRRSYVTQYLETDYEFIVRLLSEEGIFFFFAPGASSPSKSEVVVIADDASRYRPIPASIDFDLIGPSFGSASTNHPVLFVRARQGVAGDDDHLFELSLRRTVRPKAILLRDFDFRKPRLEVRARDWLRAAPPGTSTPNGAPPPETSLSPERLQVYLHHDRAEFESSSTEEIGPQQAATTLEQVRADARTARGTSACRRLLPGHTFQLAEHSIEALNRPYVITTIEHSGRAPAVAADQETHLYDNTITCVPADVPFRPTAQPRRRRQVVETAIVTGPPGEEIWVDEHGRIKVQFHWDLEGQRSERASCWVRTAQTWAGPSWGFQFIPRVGMEVVVTFLGGDMDRPLVTGCVHNGENPLPYRLPREKTRSGIRTSSTPNSLGRGGYNELSFEDSTDGEQIFLRAQRDFDEVVGRNHTSKVGFDECLQVGRHRERFVGGAETVCVRGNRSATVCEDQMVSVEGNAIDVIGGNRDVRVARRLTTRVDGAERREVKSTFDLVLGDDATTRVHGCHTTIVGKAKAKRSSVVHVEGTSSHFATDEIEIVSGKAIRFVCGKSSIRMTKSGIELHAPTVALSGGGIALDGKTVTLGASDKAMVKSAQVSLDGGGAKIALKGVAKIDASKVKINGGPDPGEIPADGGNSTKPTRFRLVDEDGKPIPYRRLVLDMPDGSERTVVVGKDGCAELELQGSGTVSIPELGNPKKVK